MTHFYGCQHAHTILEGQYPSTYSYDETSGMYYDSATGLYYDPNTQVMSVLARLHSFFFPNTNSHIQFYKSMGSMRS